MEIRDTRSTLIVENAKLTDVRFSDTDASGASFADTNLSGATFSDINLSGAGIRDANLENVVIVDSSIDGMTIDGVPVIEMLRLWRRTNPG